MGSFVRRSQRICADGGASPHWRPPRRCGDRACWYYGVARRGVRAEIMFGGRFANARIRGRASEGRVNQHAGATCLMRFAVRHGTLAASCVIGMWGGNSCGGGVGLSMPSVAVEHPNKILIRGFSHTTRRTSSRGRRGRKPEPHTQGPARASFLEQSPSKVRTAAPTHFLLPQPSSSSLPFPGAERVSDRRNRSAENSPAPALPPPLTSSPPLLPSFPLPCAARAHAGRCTIVLSVRVALPHAMGALMARFSSGGLRLVTNVLAAAVMCSCIGCVKRCAALRKSRSRSTPQARTLFFDVNLTRPPSLGWRR